MITWWRELVRRNAVLAWFGLANFGLLVALACLIPFDAHEIQGISRWVKPMKFAISIGIYAWTMAWFLGHLKPIGERAAHGIGLTVAITMFIEIFFIVLQAARGVISHFNDTSALDGNIFSLMGIAIGVNSVAVIYMLVLFCLVTPQIPRSYLWGIRLGLLIFLLASAEGGFMITHGSRYVSAGAGLHDAHPGLPFVNWSRTEGDLRVAHFIGLHALQMIPLAGFLLHRHSQNLRATRPVAWTFAFALLYGSLSAGLFIQAFLGRPFPG